ncbi:UNVERIFIED_CONTAM: hypothetical protein PYX00_010327 [Menopon gallinae]|uniref:Uncharacterized protein n=1 Tax=Menopon gallinae TaxID=328185 RepID=A0AAW2HFR6_9NEOP
MEVFLEMTFRTRFARSGSNTKRSSGSFGRGHAIIRSAEADDPSPALTRIQGIVRDVQVGRDSIMAGETVHQR